MRLGKIYLPPENNFNGSNIFRINWLQRHRGDHKKISCFHYFNIVNSDRFNKSVKYIKPLHL